MFAPFMSNAGMTEVFDMATKNMQSFFQNNNQLWKEYTNAIQLLSQKYPQLISGDFAKLSDLFNQMNDVFGKTFSPVINLMTSAKEKEQVEAMVNLMDKVAEFSVRQTQLQHHFYTTSQKAMEQAAKTVASKWNNTLSENQSFNEFYNEWIKVNEAAFTELYKSEEFSKLKSDVLSAGADVKLSFEKQFEYYFNVYPVVFRSELEELHKTIYDLKKQIKSLESRLNDGAENKEEKTSKRK